MISSTTAGPGNLAVIHVHHATSGFGNPEYVADMKSSCSPKTGAPRHRRGILEVSYIHKGIYSLTLLHFDTLPDLQGWTILPHTGVRQKRAHILPHMRIPTPTRAMIPMLYTQRSDIRSDYQDGEKGCHKRERERDGSERLVLKCLE